MPGLSLLGDMGGFGLSLSPRHLMGGAVLANANIFILSPVRTRARIFARHIAPKKNKRLLANPCFIVDN